MQNTRIDYTYVDGSNNKVSGSAVLSGPITETGRRKIFARLEDLGNGPTDFIPGQVGLKDLQDNFQDPSEWDPERDTPWHVLDEITVTALAADMELAVEDLVSAFEKVDWDHGYLPPFHDEMSARHEARVAAEDEGDTPAP